MARLRASVITAPVDVYSTLPGNAPHHNAPLMGMPKRKRTRKKRSKKKKHSGLVKATPEEPSKRTQEPPRLTADHFPTLQDERVEWETAAPGILTRQDTLEDDSRSDDDDDDKSSSTYSESDERKSTRPYSDVASTATTTSSTATGTSSSLSGTDLPKSTGYAAAVLKNVPSSPTIATAPREGTNTDSASAVVREVTGALSSASIEDQSRSWGNSQQSFADIVRSDQP